MSIHTQSPGELTDEPERGVARPLRRYVVVLAVSSALILLVGILMRPARQDETPPPPPSELDFARLAHLSQRRLLDNTTQFFSTVADKAARWVAVADPLNTNGVFLQPDLFVVPGSRMPLPDTVVLHTGAGTMRARQFASGPHLPIAVFEPIEHRPADAATLARSEGDSGEWMVAVWRDRHQHYFAPGIYVSTHATVCGVVTVEVVKSTLAATAVAPGAAVFDADGGFLGMAAPCVGRLEIITHASIRRLIEHATSVEGRLLAAFGFRAEQPSLDEAAFFKITGGALTREVWRGYPAALSGLWPGDVIRAIDDHPVTAPADLKALLETRVEPPVLKVERGSRQLDLTLADSVAQTETSRPAGLLLEPDREGYRIDAVIPGSAAFRAGLRPGDILLRINHAEPRNLAQLRKVLAGSASAAAFVEIEREGRRFGVLIS